MRSARRPARRIAPAVVLAGVIAATVSTGIANTSVGANAASTELNQTGETSYDPYEGLAQLVRENYGEDYLGGLISMSITQEGITSVVVPWVGPVPGWLEQGVELVASRTDAEISIEPAENTSVEMMAAAAAVHELLPAKVSAGTSIGIGVDTLTVRGPSVSVNLKTAPEEVDQSWKEFVADAAKRTEADSIEVLFEFDPLAPVSAARTGDTTAFRGGSSYFTSTPVGTFGCTTGFPAQLGSTMMILTAAHCSKYLDGQPVVSSTSGGGTGASMGVTDYIWEMQDLAPSYDLGLIRLNGGHTNLASVYADPMFSTVTVRGAASGMPPGGNYCSSGNVTRAKCNVLAEGQEYVCYPNTPYPDECQYTIRVVSTNGAPVFCKGDSGGPIYYHHLGLGSPNVTAAGIISGIRTTAGGSCGTTGFASVVASAISKVPGLQIRYQP